MQNYFKTVLTFLPILFLNETAYSQSKKLNDSVEVIRCISYLTYPKEAQDNNISGTVIVLFDTDSNCRAVNIRIEKGIGYGCDEEAIKLVKGCPSKFKNNNIRCIERFNLRQPVTFANADEE